MRFSVILVALATTFASVQASTLLRRASDASACASKCSAESATNNIDAATDCTTKADGDSTKLEICLCTTPALLKGVTDCMERECPDNASLFQDGCDIVTGKSSTDPSIPSIPLPDSTSKTTTDGTGSASSIGVSAAAALTSLLFAGVALF
ncbi:hypothetical protein EXIGLDRAFT_719452 [Exidia glandulosa HHB12029]|uniref:Extracellular membrane protein CFEM domain-containing protein n=1 Tax=Exidia glandulosa HHB12029 TaxID=1314781 RepID=A0A165NPV0_EXIGL|nr:hypothetical protein EXIGLDRAFT_719452 [Exidia glandulosa HHB12029]